jgi:hypothetical protein
MTTPDNGAYDKLRLKQSATWTVDGKEATILCDCCSGHDDYLVTPARLCPECGAFCQCGGCQADSAARVE